MIDSISSSPYVRGFLASAPDFRAKTVNDLGRSDPIQPFFNDIINLLEGEEERGRGRANAERKQINGLAGADWMAGKFTN